MSDIKYNFVFQQKLWPFKIDSTYNVFIVMKTLIFELKIKLVLLLLELKRKNTNVSRSSKKSVFGGSKDLDQPDKSHNLIRISAGNRHSPQYPMIL